MDPLSQVVDPFRLPRISALAPSPNMSGAQKELPNCHSTSPFPLRPDLNEKVALWNGDLALLSMAAVVNPSSESFSDRNPVSDAIYTAAGPELKHHLKTVVRSCRTGDAKITGGYHLPARHVIHTVGPRYNAKYRTAAESTLYSCYRGIMQLMREHHLTSVAIPCIHANKRGYPTEEGAHIAIRTIRRFLEKFEDDIELVVFVAGAEYPVYRDLLPLYFPRTSEEEAYAAKALPEDVGNSTGEPVIQERQIRINPLPHKRDSVNNMDWEPAENELDEQEEEKEEEEEEPIDIGPNPFLKLAPDQDVARREQVKQQLSSNSQDRARRYDSCKRRARQENIKDLVDLQCLYRAGVDSLGREVVVFVGKLYPAAKVTENQALAFFITQMDAVVNSPFVVIYLNTCTVEENVYDSEFYKQLYLSLDDRYIDHLRGLYIVHPSFWMKASCWWFLTFTASDIKSKVHHIQEIRQLYSFVQPRQLNLPQFVLDYDRKISNQTLGDPLASPQVAIEEPDAL